MTFQTNGVQIFGVCSDRSIVRTEANSSKCLLVKGQLLWFAFVLQHRCIIFLTARLGLPPREQRVVRGKTRCVYNQRMKQSFGETYSRDYHDYCAMQGTCGIKIFITISRIHFTFPANMRPSNNVGLMLGQRRVCWVHAGGTTRILSSRSVHISGK